MSKPNIFLEKVPRKTKAMVKILVSGSTVNIEDRYEQFCEILFNEGGVIKGCQFASDPPSESHDSYYNIVIYYEIEKDRVEQFKNEVRECSL